MLHISFHYFCYSCIFKHQLIQLDSHECQHKGKNAFWDVSRGKSEDVVRNPETNAVSQIEEEGL